MYALGRLEQEGFIRLRPNLGYFVKEIDRNEFQDLFDVREALEIYALKLAIKNQTEADLRKLKEKLQQHADYRVQVYDRKKLVFDINVHLHIAQMSKNKVLVRQLHQVLEQLYLRCRVELMNPIRLPVSPGEHQQILAKIKERDYSGAEKLLRGHIQGAKHNLISSIFKEDTFDFAVLSDFKNLWSTTPL